MSQLERHVAIVRSREAITHTLRALAWAAVGVATLAILAIVVERFLLGRNGAPTYRWLAGHPWIVLLSILGVGAIASIVWGMRRRPSPREAAARIDEALGTKEVFSTALYLRTMPEAASDPFARAAVMDAFRRADNVSLAGRFPIRFPRLFSVAILLGLVAFGLSFIRCYDLFGREQAAKVKAVEIAKQTEVRKQIEQAIAQINLAAPEVQAQEDIQLAKQKLQAELTQNIGDTEAARRTAAKAQQSLKDAQQNHEKIKNVQDFAKARQNQRLLQSMNNDPADHSAVAEMQRDMKAGNFDGAMDKMAKLAEDFDRMPPEDQQKAADQMNAMSQQLQQALDSDTKQQLQQLAQQMQQNGVNQQQVQKLQQLAQQAAQGNQQAQQQVQQQVQQMMAQANASPAQQQAVQQLASQMQGIQNSAALMQQLQQAAAQMGQAMQQQAGAPNGQQQQAGQKANAGQQQAGGQQQQQGGQQQAGGQQQQQAGQPGGQQPGQQAGQQAGQQQNGQQQQGGQQQGGQQAGGQQQGQQSGAGQPGGQGQGNKPGGNQQGQNGGGNQPGNGQGQGQGQGAGQQMKAAVDAMRQDLKQMQGQQQQQQQQGQQQQGGNNNGNGNGQGNNNGGQQQGGQNGQNGGWQPGQPQGQGQGQGGPGQGAGGNTGMQEAPFDFKRENSKSQNRDEGRVLAQTLVKADSDRGESTAALREAVRSNIQDATDEVDNQRVSRQAQKAVRDYFSGLTGDPALGEAAAKPTQPAPAPAP